MVNRTTIDHSSSETGNGHTSGKPVCITKSVLLDLPVMDDQTLSHLRNVLDYYVVQDQTYLALLSAVMKEILKRKKNANKVQIRAAYVQVLHPSRDVEIQRFADLFTKDLLDKVLEIYQHYIKPLIDVGDPSMDFYRIVTFHLKDRKADGSKVTKALVYSAFGLLKPYFRADCKMYDVISYLSTHVEGMGSESGWSRYMKL